LALTRPMSFEDQMGEGLKKLGAMLTYVPSIHIKSRPEFQEELRGVELSRFGGYVFASKEGVERFFAALRANRTDIRRLKGSFFAIGRTTAEALASRGIVDGIIQGDGNASDMVKRINDHLDQSEKKELLLITGTKTCGNWHEKVTGWEIRRLVAYETEVGYQHGLDEPVDGILFMSSSAVRGFFQGGLGTPHMISEEEIRGITAICSGKSCGETAKEMGFKNVVISERPEGSAMIETVKAWRIADTTRD